MSPHRLAIATAAAAVVLPALLSAAPGAAAKPLPVPSPGPAHHLTVTISDTGNAADGRTYDLYCHPTGGSHPSPEAACAEVSKKTVWGADPFAPVPKGAACTKIYGGPATGHVEGRWSGRPVNADFSRADGCEIGRWNKFAKLLGTPRN
ncbi:SSI family serine proteinase inhibitor [Streptomyces zagrosensis]|uniref:Putative alpha-1,2-mannosidase n=1 Tax=Streptomyces zagrosensis TaxID=1042984 RepID=A0A7W9Q6H1_9ACTN|nr:SSI family serine proteinase inhibitor [Streptomyces zagrosensis]MBB5934269.1 putative alpha-1,2-mannosidase [Streptomyces zagrosensis]